MTENVQCPVCTLFLHAGMSLSDHLETHPKEQVIRALVQLTISGPAVGNTNNNTLASVLAGETKTGSTPKDQSIAFDEKSLSSFKGTEHNIGSTGNSCSATLSNSASNCSSSNQSACSSPNSNNLLNFSDSKTEKHNENEQEKKSTSLSIGADKTVVKTEMTNVVTMTKNIVADRENSQCFSKQNFCQTNLPSNLTTTAASHSYHNNALELTNAPSNHNNFTMFGSNTRYDQQQRNDGNNQLSSLPMPPPPPPSTSQNQHPCQHQEIGGRGIVPTGSSGTFHTIQPLLPTPHQSPSHLGNTSSGLRQSHMFVAGQHQQPLTNTHHTQSLKVIYTPNLPPPPPLQLFTYQPQTHLQHHQKPPPAYGTAISQIRSQYNQSKHQVTASLAIQHQHQTLQAQLQQQQQQQSLQQNIRVQVPPPPPQPQPLSIGSKQTFSPKNSDLPNQNHGTTSKHNQQQQQPKADLSQQQQEEQISQTNSENTNNSNNHIFNSNEIFNKSSLKVTSSATLQNQNANVSSYPQVSISPSTASVSMAAVAASTLGRHTNSPFAALLAAAAGAPSPSNTSSVLRYAESPVAHYLERDNGDFIVQETPKHIVECVETDNGEFSVIERIYQSPPSVLHIHDDDDDDDDNCENRLEDEQHENAHNKSKQHDKNVGESEKTKNELDEKQKKSSTKHVKSNKPKEISNSDDQASDTNDVVDFVSISSDSGDEEEFISQELKEHKNTTEKKKTIPSTLAMSTTTTQSLSTSSSLSPASSTSSGDPQIPISTTTTSLHTSSLVAANTISTQQNSVASTSNNTGSRKKSSKNTITVLSDVQLNLNEYLDLVGNIIASSKVAAQRKTFASIAPIPLVKIEKEEPMDEYAITNSTTMTATTLATSTNFETPPPFTASKQETEEITDIPSSSYKKKPTNNHNVILTTEPDRIHQDEKKHQVFISASENETTSIAISNASASLMTINSSHVTSVIRMATTSQHQQQEQLLNSLETIKNINEAEDLSQTQQKVQILTNSKTLGHMPMPRKGPKKLVIKPKSTKTEVLPSATTVSKPNQNQTNDDQDMPTTSAKARQEYTKQNSFDDDPLNTADIKIKNEPITSIKYENLSQQPQYQIPTSFSILEHHLSSKEPILEFKEEKPCITETSLLSSSIIKEMKTENNVNEDARVLYDFANSKKPETKPPSIFPSSSSLFSGKQTSAEMTSVEEVKSQQNSKNINHENEASTSSSTYSSSQSVMDASLLPEEQNESSAANTSAPPTAQTQHQNNQVYTDFHFNYLYNNGDNNNAAGDQADIKNHQQFTFYQNSTNNNNNNNAVLLEDSSSSKNYADYQQLHHNHHHIQQQHHSAGTSDDQWFNNNYQASEPNITPITSNHSVSNINSGLSVDGNAPALDGSESSKYLDLDSCKREQNNMDRISVPPPPPPSSSTSCSFNGTTDNSMAGICSTAATLNIRTDEKMPAKGEISEQESNCDIDNSWSQPMYGDISARFFKTTFPGIFPHDNGWNHDEYFSVQDLSASTTAHATSNNRLKSFEQTNSNNNNSTGMAIFSQSSNDNCNIDVMPSTSAKIRKRRKRCSQDGKSSQPNGKRVQPTSTVTSQQMINQNEVTGIEFGFQHQQLQQQHHLQQQQHLQQPNTSTAFLAGPSNASSALSTGFIMQQQQQVQRLQQNQTQLKQRTKIYECGHCNAKYSKLKDRNAHMIDIHNYIRQNRRLVCPTTGLTTHLNNPEMQDVTLPTTSAAGSMIPTMQNIDCMSDYKQGIVKIENENPQRDLPGVEPINANLSAKTEIMEDDKQRLALVSMNAINVETTPEHDTKPPPSSLPLSLTTPTSKLTTLYRMLVSFNMTTLKQHQNLSELDENLIKSSIFFCYICRQNFNSVKLYDAHLTEHPAECFTCGKKFQRWKNFSLHLKRHLGWKEFGCTVCDKKFVVRSALVEHMRMHSGLSPLKCKVCGKNFKRYSNLTQHRKRHSKQIIRRKEYVCYCGEVLPSKARFLWHKETHDSKPKCCPHCCDRFVHVNSLRRHIRLAHSDKFDYTEPMECPICKQIFAKASMKAHMATHSTETQYDCAICNKSFSTKWNLKIHSWVHANRTAKPFKCEHCPKAFVREVDFKNHMNSHKQIKPYTCEVCGCKFIRKYNYMRHRREHHGNKKYTCDLCKKSFHRHYYLIEHRRIHTGERPFQCSICGKSSTTKTNHNKHLKIHHSRDPFTVEV